MGSGRCLPRERDLPTACGELTTRAPQPEAAGQDFVARRNELVLSCV